MSKSSGAPLGEAIHEYLDRSGLRRRFEDARVVNEWDQLVGPRFADVTWPRAVDQSGTLWVAVKSAAWIQELQMMTPTIVAELARQGRPIKSIRWVAGSSPPPPTDDRPTDEVI